MKEKLLLFLGFIWAATVIGYWCFWHFFQKKVLWLELALTPLVLGLTFGLGFLYLFFIKKKTRFTITFSPLWIIVLLWVIILLLFTLSGFVQVNRITWTPLFEFSEWLPNTLHLTLLFLQAIGILGIMSIVTWCIGRLIFSRLPNVILPPLFAFLFINSLGIFAIVGITVLLGLFNILSSLVVLPLALAGVVLERKNLLSFVRQLYQKRFFTFTITTQNFWLGLTLVLFAALVIVDSIKPIPTGFDDMNYYMNRVRLMIENQELIFGNYPFSFEILATFFQSLSFFATSNLLPALLTGMLMMTLAGLALYGLIKEYTGHPGSALAITTLWGALSMTQSLTVREVKPDTLLFFLCTLFLWSLLLWYRQKHFFFLGTTAFLFGLAVTTKITVVFFLPGLAIVTLFWWWKNNWPLPVYTCFLKLLALLLLPLAVWFLVTLQSHWLTYSLSKLSLNPLLSHSPYAISALEWNKILTPDCPAPPNLDLARYQKQNSSALLGALWLPWDLTMNNRVGYFVTEISFLFLIFLPIIFLRTLIIRKPLTDLDWLCAIISLGYFATWLVLGKYVPWYAYPGFILLFIPLAKEWASSKKTWFWFLNILLWLTLSTQLMVRLQYFAPVVSLSYLAGQSSREDFPRELYPQLTAVAAVINTTPQNRVIVPASKIRYLITQNHERLITDDRLGILSCLQYTFEDNSLVVQTLQDFKISYIYISADLVQSSAQLGESEKARVQALITFAQEHLVSEPLAPGLYKVPRR